MFRLSGRHSRLAVVVAGTLALGACGTDKRVKALSAGITRDSTLKIIGEGAVADSGLANVYRQEEYLTNGHMLEILFFSPDGAREGVDSVDVAGLTPIVLQDGSLAATGWDAYDSVATANNLVRTLVP